MTANGTKQVLISPRILFYFLEMDVTTVISMVGAAYGPKAEIFGDVLNIEVSASQPEIQQAFLVSEYTWNKSTIDDQLHVCHLYTRIGDMSFLILSIWIVNRVAAVGE
jgi:hypothetical protein